MRENYETHTRNISTGKSNYRNIYLGTVDEIRGLCAKLKQIATLLKFERTKEKKRNRTFGLSSSFTIEI